ncbi:MAG: class I SAM-dependent methyltransferase [Peptococcaceae bacterium]|nr:class I SAM-dependent methyltransferase [Peptococcaceae bacterium]
MQNLADDPKVWTGSDYEFDFIAQNVFYPIYDVIAGDILKRTQSMQGRLIDIGCGGGHLGMALMEKTGHQGYFVDINETALKIARKRAGERGLAGRCFFSRQDVHAMDFPDGFADLIVSRGSYHFWQDLEKALLEIYRILAPRGRTYIGGGMGNSELEAAIREKMQGLQPGWPENIRRRTQSIPTAKLENMLTRQGISHEIVENPEQGRWIILAKEPDHP